MEKKYEVFISSTSRDLSAVRQYVRDYIIHSGHIPVGMEVFEGGARPPWQKIEEAIRRCDYYVLIVGGRYGSVKPDDPEGLSYTECEYRLAQDLGKEVMVFLLSEAGLAALAPEGRERDEEAARKLDNFRRRVRGGYVVEWNNAEELESFVSWKILRWMNERTPPATSGWVRAAELHELEARLGARLARALSELELECSRKDVYTYLFDRLNPFDDVPLTRQFLQDLDTKLDQISKVLRALENLIDHYVKRVIPTTCRVYFAYSLCRGDLGREVNLAAEVKIDQPVYALGISNSKEGKWLQGEIFAGPSNLHNVYRRRETLGIRDVRSPAPGPAQVNKPVADECSVIATPVLYGAGTHSMSLGVVGISSPEVGQAVEHYPLVRELGILFSALFYAYGQHLKQHAGRGLRRDDKSIALRLRNDIVDHYVDTGALKLRAAD